MFCARQVLTASVIFLSWILLPSRLGSREKITFGSLGSPALAGSLKAELQTLSPSSSSGTRLDQLIHEIRSEVKPQQAMEYMRRIYATDRWFTFPKFQETAQYVRDRMKEIGLSGVEVIDAPADGISQFGHWTMPLAWDVKHARLEIMDPAVPEEFRVLADYEKVPASLGMWSGATSPEGVTAEVVELKESSPEATEKLNLKDKLVVTHQNPSNIKWLLARKGALGAINAFTENADLQDGRQWINAWGDNGWAFIKGSSPLLCFSITPRQSAFLQKLLAEKSPVRVKATVDSRYYYGAYPYVTGLIPGAQPGEETLTLGHTSEQGAQDNATGVAAMLEALATLHRLIASGQLPRPARAIRILAMGEMYGSMHYIATNPDRIRRTVAAICLDTPAASYQLAGTEYTFYLNPHVAKSYVDALILRVAGSYFSNLSQPRPWHWREYMTGTDTYLGEPAIGIPTVWPYSGSGIHTHHNSADTPADVDPRSLRDLAAITAAYLYFVASGGESDALWLAELALNRGFDQILDANAKNLDRVFSTNRAEDLGQILAQAREKIAYLAERESQSVLSVLRLVPEARREPARSLLDPLLASLRTFGQEQSERLERAVQQRAAQLGIRAPIRPLPAPDPQLASASEIVVKRKKFGTIPLDEIPPDRRKGYPSGAWDPVPIAALYWCDGERNLAEVMRLTQLELGPSSFDFVGYFRFLEEHGYVEFLKR